MFVASAGLFPAHAQEIMCYPRTAVEARLTGDLGESPVQVGVTAQNELMEIWAAPDGSWTLVINKIDGSKVLTCPLMQGDGLETVSPKIAGNDS